jgi:hypothetical protein
MKEKLKRIKLVLKMRHQNHTQNLSGKISHLKEHISLLDYKLEPSFLLDGEVEELHGLVAELHSLSIIHTSICWQ